MHIPSHPVHSAAHCNPLQPTATNPVHIQCTHCSSHYIFSAHCSYTIQCTLQLFHLVHTAAILSSAHCSYTIQCTLQLFHLVHTAATLSSAHCSYTIQCTLQPCTAICSQPSVHTAANCSYSIQCTLHLHYMVPILYIQCTFEPPQGKPIPLLAYLQSSQQTLMVDCSSP